MLLVISLRYLLFFRRNLESWLDENGKSEKNVGIPDEQKIIRKIPNKQMVGEKLPSDQNKQMGKLN